MIVCIQMFRDKTIAFVFLSLLTYLFVFGFQISNQLSWLTVISHIKNYKLIREDVAIEEIKQANRSFEKKVIWFQVGCYTFYIIS
mmetsp:Transcript_26432/g.30559  ORF Transcript_26432/g.30559 Transcript_26432/m.30559 type:complete len:85 (-) Transcript_26432:656-910(-)